MEIKAEEYNLNVKLQSEEDTEYKPLGCVLEYENLMHEGTRDVAGKRCKNLDSTDNGKRLKAKKFDNGSITYIYDYAATDGRKTIKDAFDNEAENIKLTITLILDDKPEGASTSATYITRDVLVTSIVPAADEDVYIEKVTLEFLNAPTTIPKSA